MYPVREISTGTPRRRAGVTRKYLRFATSAPSTHFSRIARLVGPCRARAPSRSEMSSTVTCSPWLFMWIQRRLGSAAVQR